MGQIYIVILKHLTLPLSSKAVEGRSKRTTVFNFAIV
jgi:hypothetical protein